MKSYGVGLNIITSNLSSSFLVATVGCFCLFISPVLPPPSKPPGHLEEGVNVQRAIEVYYIVLLCIFFRIFPSSWAVLSILCREEIDGIIYTAAASQGPPCCTLFETHAQHQLPECYQLHELGMGCWWLWSFIPTQPTSVVGAQGLKLINPTANQIPWHLSPSFKFSSSADSVICVERISIALSKSPSASSKACALVCAYPCHVNIIKYIYAVKESHWSIQSNCLPYACHRQSPKSNLSLLESLPIFWSRGAARFWSKPISCNWPGQGEQETTTAGLLWW